MLIVQLLPSFSAADSLSDPFYSLQYPYASLPMASATLLSLFIITMSITQLFTVSLNSNGVPFASWVLSSLQLYYSILADLNGISR